MTTLLQINASIHADHGQSSQLATQFVQAFIRSHPDSRVVLRDLAGDTVPHLSAERFAAFVFYVGQLGQIGSQRRDGLIGVDGERDADFRSRDDVDGNFVAVEGFEDRAQESMGQ